MQTVNVKNNKYCLNCRFWTGPLVPKINAPGSFNVDDSHKSICYKTHIERLWSFHCDKWAIKQELE